MERLEIATEGGRLRALRWGRGDNVALALHGITSNAMAWAVVAEALPEDWSLVALDQRGRGHSRELPPPYDGDRLAADAKDAVEATGARVLAGHSMGAYVTAGTEHLFPGLCERLVLVDGGVPLPMPTDLDVDETLKTTLGPALAKLEETYPSEQAYVDSFKAHPAMGPYWSAAIEAYARYDCRETEEGVRARAVKDAVRTSGRELLERSEQIAEAVDGLSVPADLLYAPRGMFDQPGGLLPLPAIEAAAQRQPLLKAQEITDTNHYTILLAPESARRVAAAVIG